MTIFGWDASHHDWGRGPMDIAAAVHDGISFMTHKIGEARTVTDDRFDDWYKRARAAKVRLLGAYYVNHPGDQRYQADRFLSMLDDRAPGWRDGPFILQVDAERFDYMEREPSPAEIKAFCDRLVERTKGIYRPIVYAPKWLYHDRLKGLGYPLWASDYDTNPAVHYRKAYPGDKSDRWVSYSGQTPAILQYGSRTRIGSQPTCDANAFRGTLEQLTALVYPEGDDMPTAKEIAQAVWNTDNIVAAPYPVRTPQNQYWAPGTTLSHGLGQAIEANQRVAELAVKVDGMVTIIATLADALHAGGSLDTAAVLAKLDGLAKQVAQLSAERDELNRKLAEAYGGQSQAES
jgi:GH25 family lysozyme M1 (1,4-beta-N-acetylmuramidase)